MKAFIFDLDGVICSTDELHYLAWKALADREGIPFDRVMGNRMRGVSRMACLEIMLEKANHSYTEEEKKEMADFKNSRYVALLDKLTEKDLSEEARSTLQALKKKGYRIAIGSSSKNTPIILRKLGIYDWFDAVVDGNMITHSKPHPEVFLKAAKLLCLPPEECFVVEDAVAGIDAAKAGGFVSIGISDASRYEKADYKIHTFSDLLNIVK